MLYDGVLMKQWQCRLWLLVTWQWLCLFINVRINDQPTAVMTMPMTPTSRQQPTSLT